MQKAVLLARVSTVRQEESGLSLRKIQLPSLRQYALKNDFEIVREFVFQETADRKIRKNFNEFLSFIRKAKDVNVIISFRVDRTTRNYRDAVLMDDLMQEYDKELHFVDDRLVLNNRTVGRDTQDWDMKVFLAKQYLNRLKEDAYKTIDTKVANGEIHGIAPYGYENYKTEEGHNWVRPKPFEAEVIKKIYSWYCTGSYSYLQILENVYQEFGLKFHKTKVEKILSNPMYMGLASSRGILYPHKYETIISEELFEMAKAIRIQRTKKKGKLIAKTGIYRGLIYCDKCGCSITPELHYKHQQNGNVHEYIYYHCTGSKGKHPDKWVEEKELTRQFGEIYKCMRIPKKKLDFMTKSLREAHEAKVDFNSTSFKDLTKRIEKLNKRIEKIYLDKIDGIISEDMYRKLNNEFRTEQKHLESKLASLTRADESYYITASYLLDIASKSYDIFIGSDIDKKRKILTMTLQNLTLKDGKLHYDLVKPFNSIFVSSKRPSWLATLDSFLNLQIDFNLNLDTYKLILNT